MTATATILYEFTTDIGGSVAVVSVDPPLAGHEFVVSSAIDLPPLGGRVECETYIFAADADAVAARERSMDSLVSDWCELPGSVKGLKDHDYVLGRVGYAVVRQA